MRDARIDQLAKTLVTYSTDVKPGDRVMIRGTEQSQPLALSVYREVLKAGGFPTIWSSFEEASWMLFRHGSEQQIGWLDPLLVEASRSIDVYISLRAPTNLKMLTEIDPALQVIARKANRPFLDAVLKKRWVICELPTPALAQEAGMSLADFEEFSFGAVSVDWPAMEVELRARKAQFESAKEVRIIGRGTDLRMDVAGRIWITDEGKHNMPGGEVFTGPIEDSAEGEILFDFPAVYGGREVEGVHLTFRAGRVVDASATRGEDYLIKMLDADEGARRLGELGVGTNYGIDRFSKSVLFDEKIGGTIHLALGRSYEETGGRNDSAIHWDMVKDLRVDGELCLDGRTVQRNGRFLD